MSELLPEIQKIAPLAEQITKLYPRLQRAKDKSITLLSKYTVIENDEQRQELVDDIVVVRETHGSMEGGRKEVTELMDQAKKLLMSPEKEVADTLDDKRKLVAQYDQKKIDDKKRVEDEARKKKEREDAKVEITTQVMKRLTNLVVERIQQMNDWVGKFLKETTLETYNERSNMLNSMQVKLKEEAWNNCFMTSFKDYSKLTQEEFEEFIKSLKTAEPFDKWNESAMKELAPVLNDWKGRLPKLKEDLLAMKNAKDEESRKQIEAKQKAESDAAEKHRQEQLNLFQKQQQDQIEEKAEVDKIGNSFQEQAEVLDVGPVGPVKLIGKFRDDKVWVKALCNMIYQAATNPKFPGIYKRDKDKNIVMDENGFPIYNDYAKPYVDFILRYGNVQVDGFEVKEISKTIIRK